jgi:glycolate oxidase FAD binding subunit
MVNAQAHPLNILVGGEHLRWSGDVVSVAPGTTEEVAGVLRYAGENGLAVVTCGGGTKQGWGYPVQPAIILETRRLNRVVEHTWQDMTCTVEAGCSWTALQSVLAQHGQSVALDPLWPEQATVGGVVATNDSGALRLRYGGLRDLVIGMTIVLADGTVARTGGKVVKNVAGYDLHKLMIGAFGTLGVVTSVNFRLYSIARCTRSYTFAGGAKVLGGILVKLLHEQLSTVSLQLRGTSEGFNLDISLASMPEVLDTQGEMLASLAGMAGVSGSGSAAWGAREELFGWDYVCKATMLPTEIAVFAERVQALGGASATQATGIMTAGFSSAEGLPQLRKDLEAAGGSLFIYKQPAASGLDCWGSLPDSIGLMREIKQRFDLQRVLSPGRFLGGI